MAAPHDAGLLDVGDGQRLHWEAWGAPGGTPAVVLHGGPGSGCAPWNLERFDLGAWRVVLPDQRGAGRSLPHASDPAADLGAITTPHLVADLERLREHLGIDRWLVHGISWGSTLGLAYAQAHPARVRALVLAPATLTRPSDVAWTTRGVARFLPEAWLAFRDGAPEGERDGDLAVAYARLLASPDADVRARAARAWCAWEEALVAHETGGAPDPRFADPRFRLGFARQVTHVWSHAAWLGEDELLCEAGRLAGVPGVVVAGRLDLGGPPLSAWELHRAWPGSELVVLEGAGHTSAGVHVAARAATDRLRGAP